MKFKGLSNGHRTHSDLRSEGLEVVASTEISTTITIQAQNQARSLIRAGEFLQKEEDISSFNLT